MCFLCAQILQGNRAKCRQNRENEVPKQDFYFSRFSGFLKTHSENKKNTSTNEAPLLLPAKIT